MTGSGDAFGNREAASENMYIRQKEMDMYVKFFLTFYLVFWVVVRDAGMAAFCRVLVLYIFVTG